MEPGSEGKNYPESLGNTFAVATMAGKDEASKQKSELWAHADAQSRSAEDLTNTDNTGLMTGLTTPVHGRNVGNDIHNEDQVSPQSVADADADLSPAQQPKEGRKELAPREIKFRYRRLDTAIAVV